jgi:uncharacterized membrane protein YfcA
MDARNTKSFVAGAAVGTLGGLIGLGGAEFRLPLLIGVFRFAPLQAVIINKAASLVVVTASLPFRMQAVSLSEVVLQWPVIINLLAGSLVGAWVGASWALRFKTSQFLWIIAVLLAAMAFFLLFGHHIGTGTEVISQGSFQMLAGLLAGFGIGVVASLLGVAGGELIIPTLILLFGVDIKLAGSMSLVISLPTMLVGFSRYSLDGSFSILRKERRFLTAMVTGSIAGAFIGGQLLRFVDGSVLLPLLSAVLLFSAYKMVRHAIDGPPH